MYGAGGFFHRMGADLRVAIYDRSPTLSRGFATQRATSVRYGLHEAFVGRVGYGDHPFRRQPAPQRSDHFLLLFCYRAGLIYNLA